DRVSQLTATPIFQAVNLAAVFFDQLGVTLNHRVNLLTLVRVNQKNDFVMTHFVLLTGYSQPPKMVWQGVELRFGAAILGKWPGSGKEKHESGGKSMICHPAHLPGEVILRWRTASNRQTPAATETFRLLTPPAIGSLAR